LIRETTSGGGTGAEQVLPTPGEEPAAAVSGVTMESRKLRLLELALVLSVAFLGPMLSALSAWWRELVRTAPTVEHPFNSGLMLEALVSQAHNALNSGNSARS